MSDAGRTLVVILSMHRSGSSLVTSILHEHGMSLGPFQLVAANDTNPHGHFEAEPIMLLNREVQLLACGFADDVPDSPETLERFVSSDGIWEGQAEIPEALYERGRELLLHLVESGRVSGFKDPRTPLVWPFWRRILDALAGVRVVPIVLTRSPHEIAMSLFSRSRGACAYRTCLDVTAVHFRRLAAIVEDWPEPVVKVRFRTPQFETDLAEAVEACGLTWVLDKARSRLDPACIHHDPATVTHEAERLYESLSGVPAAADDSRSNRATTEADALARESLYHEQLRSERSRVDDLRRRLAQAEESAHQSHEELSRAHQVYHDELGRMREVYDEELGRVRQVYDDELGRVRQLWDETRQELAAARDELARTEERRDAAEARGGPG